LNQGTANFEDPRIGRHLGVASPRREKAIRSVVVVTDDRAAEHSIAELLRASASQKSWLNL